MPAPGFSCFMRSIFAFYLLGSFAFSGWALADTEKQVKKLEDLFIWRVSEELKLNHKEEMALSSVIKETNRKKLKSNQDLEELYKKLKTEATESERKKIYGTIRSTLKNQGHLPIEELDGVNKAIGLKKLALYLEVKKDLSEKIKGVWPQGEKKTDKPLPPPQIIEEK
jgi:hypothetical protein